MPDSRKPNARRKTLTIRGLAGHSASSLYVELPKADTVGARGLTMLYPALESTASLLARVRAGDSGARDRLLVRYMAILRRWAHGRLPRRARHLADTEDLVQTTLVRALDGVQRFEPRRE